MARNDLNDADLEVVARKAPVAKRTAPPQRLADIPREKSIEHRWIKVARLFKRTSPFENPREEVQAEMKPRPELAEKI